MCSMNRILIYSCMLMRCILRRLDMQGEKWEACLNRGYFGVDFSGNNHEEEMGKVWLCFKWDRLLMVSYLAKSLGSDGYTPLKSVRRCRYLHGWVFMYRLFIRLHQVVAFSVCFIDTSAYCSMVLITYISSWQRRMNEV